jgi:hypothetical protein
MPAKFVLKTTSASGNHGELSAGQKEDRCPGHGSGHGDGSIVRIAWQGVLVLLLTLAFCANVFAAIDRNSHSVTDTLYGVFPDVVCSLGVLNWIAERASRPSVRR